MTYYMILNYDVNDPEAFADYIPKAMPSMQQYGARLLAVGRDGGDLEGQSQDSLVILSFESEAAAMAWYHSPEYAEALQLRLTTTSGWARGLEEFRPPGSS
jgi:uncharacterized protein (DUF1330 family)